MWAAGAGALILPFCAYWILTGALPHMFLHLIFYPLMIYPKTSSLPHPVISLQNTLDQNLVTALFYIPPLIVILVAIWLAKNIIRMAW